MTKLINILFIYCIPLLFSSVNQTKGQEYLRNSNKQELHPATEAIFSEIEEGLAEGSVNKLVKFLSPQTYLSLSNGISGYYSANQAYYVLEDYFRTNQVTEFRFDDTKFEQSNIYGTGTYRYVTKGKRESAQVYISLKHIGKKWKITQLTIN